MLRAAESTQAIPATSGRGVEPEQDPAESYPPAVDDDERDERDERDDDNARDEHDERTRPTPAPGGARDEAADGVPDRPGPAERRYGP
ncbi:MAG: hypothetical protein HOV83_28165 [Catenulispora sp.]|nr:hypothetical protein [Catenulispora sp.]